MTRLTWMIVQGALIGGLGFLTLGGDVENLKREPSLLLVGLFVGWLIAEALTQSLTRLYDWCRFRLPRLVSKVRQPQRQSLSLGTPDRLPRQLPEDRQSSRIGKEPR